MVVERNSFQGCDELIDMSIFSDNAPTISETMAKLDLVDHQPDTDSGLLFEQFPTYRILSLTSRLNRQAVQILDKACGLRLPEWRCMAMIGRHDKLNLFNISEIAGMDRAQVTRSIQGLVERGFVLTQRDTADRRIVSAKLTKAGQRVYEKTLPIMEQRQLQLLASLSPSDRKAFYRIMDNLNNALATWEHERRSHETG